MLRKPKNSSQKGDKSKFFRTYPQKHSKQIDREENRHEIIELFTLSIDINTNGIHPSGSEARRTRR